MARTYFFSVQFSLTALLLAYAVGTHKYGPAAHLAVYGLLILVAVFHKKGSMIPLWTLAAIGVLIGGGDVLFYLYKAKLVTVFIFLHLILAGGSLFLLSITNAANETEEGQLIDRFNLWVPPTALMSTCAAYLVLDFGTPAWDQARHLINAFRVYDLFFSSGANKILDPLLFYDFYPSIPYIVGALFAAVLGKTTTAVALSLPLFWFPLGWYFIRKHLLDIASNRTAPDAWASSERSERPAAEIATLLVMGSAMSLGLTKSFLIDFPPFVMTGVFAFFLHRSAGFTDRKYSLAAGIAFGLGLLSKQTFLYFAVFPLLYEAFFAFRENTERATSLRFFRNVYFFVLGSFLTAGLWFTAFLKFFLHDNRAQKTFGVDEGDPSPFSPASFAWYFPRLVEYFSLPVFIILILSAVFFVTFKKLSLRQRLAPILAMVAIYLLSSLRWNKDYRFLTGIAFFAAPMFFYFFAEYSRARLLKVLAAFSVAWILAGAFSQVLKIPIPTVPLILASAGYGAEDRPIPATQDNVPEIFSAGIKLFSMENPAACFQTNFQNGFGTASFHQAAYDLYRRFLFPTAPAESRKILPAGEIKNLATLFNISGNALLMDSPAIPGVTYFIVRDPYWNDYTLLRAERRGDSLEIEIRQTLTRIGGDLVAHLKEGGKDREISLSSGRAVVNAGKDSEIYFTKRNTYDGRYRIDWALELEGKRASDDQVAKLYGSSIKDNRISL